MVKPSTASRPLMAIYTVCVALAGVGVDLVAGQYQQQQQQHVQQGVPQQGYVGQGHPPAAGQVQYGQPQGHHAPVVGQGMAPGQVPHYQEASSNLLHDQARIHDREHLREHLHGVINEPDLSKMSEEELQFHYFKLHDNDNNNMLDGSELIKSLIHWHVEENKNLGANAHPQGTTKIFADQELAQMIDPILEMDDKNRDGFIDYPEFIAAQKARGF